MDWDRIEGSWKELSGKVRKQWGDLTDSEIERSKGKRDELIGIVQQRYGYAKDKARIEVDKWAESLNGGLSTAVRDVADRGRQVQQHLGEVGSNVGGAVQRSLKEQPTATLVWAAVIGFALGAIWRS